MIGLVSEISNGCLTHSSNKCMITISSTNKGNMFSKTISHLEKMEEFTERDILEKYGQLGVELLREATPVRTGKTAASWYYEIKHEGTTSSIVWKNSNENKGQSIALLIQYGHGTRSGGFVQGVDYINPAMLKLFDKIIEDLEKEVKSL